MLGMSAFNRKPRQYSHKPIYYNPDKEAREQRTMNALGESDPNYVPGKYIHNQRRDRVLGLDRPQTSTVDKRKILTRLLIAICLLVIIGYIIAKSDVILKLVEL